MSSLNGREVAVITGASGGVGRVGLLCEQYDAQNGRLVGNFPQAFSGVFPRGIDQHGAEPVARRSRFVAERGLTSAADSK